MHLEYLQAILKEFDPIAAPNKETLIHYFREELCLSIRAQLDNQGWDLDMWNKVVEKTVNVEVKADRQLPFETRKIDFRYLRGYRPLVKKDKDKTNREHWDEAPKDKTKSHNSFFAN